MSIDEYEAFVAAAEKVSGAHRGSPIEGMFSEFLTLLSRAVESDVAAASATAALAAAVAAVRTHRPGGMPSGEREAWERAGARFDERAVPIVEARAAAAFAELVERSTCGDNAVAGLLRVDRSRVSQRFTERSVYAFVGPGEERYFPNWQFVGHRTLPGLKQVLSAIAPELHPLSVDHFFTHSNVDLEVDAEPTSPVRWLATGGSATVVAELAADL
jgi:hypothetical protein